MEDTEGGGQVNTVLEMPNRRALILKLTSRRIISATVAPGVDTLCWIWTGGANGDDYGSVRIGNKTYLVHRVSAHLWHDMPLDSPELVRHKCEGQPRCFNPKHLLLGDHFDNNRDTVESGRHRNAALTSNDVRKLIFAVRSGRTHIAKWAAGHGVSYSTAYQAYKGITHLEDAVMYHGVCTQKSFAIAAPAVLGRLVSESRQRHAIEPENDRDLIAIEEANKELPF